ncbi:MAG: NAD-dependent epimerase/dehydratase family protein [Planctomycetes bacterium]|nr:NAD-dependent epimerase/dehydratase family protein [Planctomycetota bacterium]
MKRKALIIGGTGTISLATTRLLAERDEWDLYILNRGSRPEVLPEGVPLLQADIADENRVLDIIGPHHFDVVVDFITFKPEQAERAVRLFSGRCYQYIFVSSCATYEKPVKRLPIREDTPQKNPYWQYARDKIACETILLNAYRRDELPLTIVRPSHTYDNRNVPVAVRGANKSWQVVCRARQQKPVIIHGDGNTFWTLTHADDFAVGMAGLMGHPGALGEAVNLVSDDVMTWNEIHQHLGRALGQELCAVHIASGTLAKHNEELYGSLLGDKAHNLYFDNSKLRRLVPEFETRHRFANAVRDILRTMDADPTLQREDPEFDAWCDAMCDRYAT